MRLKILYLISVCIFTLVTFLCQGEEVYTINRTSELVADVFKVPASNCTKGGADCTAYNNAYQDGPCKCSCPYDASTFGFYSGSWTCLNKTEVRRQAACKLIFDDSERADQEPLMTMEKGTYYYVILPSESCSLNLAASLYFDCGGKWKKLGWNTSSTELVYTKQQTDPSTNLQWEYSFILKRISKLVAGRIISLHFNCTNPSQSSCVLFKTEGQITCPAVISSTPNPISVTVTTVTTTKSPDSRNNQTQHGNQGGSSSSSPGTIAAGVIVAIFVILLAAVIGFVVWKKNKGENILLMDTMLGIVKKARRSSSTSPAVEDANEEVYTEIPDQLAQRQTATRTDILVGSIGINNYVFEQPHPQPIYALPEERYASLVRNSNSMIQEEPFTLVRNSNSMIQEEPFTDDEGYLEPRQMPVYVEFEGAKEQVTVAGSTENSKTDGKGDQNEQQNSSKRSGEGSGVTPVIYACVNKERKLPKLPTARQSTDGDTEKETKQHQQKASSNRSGEGSGVTPVIYACVNKERKLPKLNTKPST